MYNEYEDEDILLGDDDIDPYAHDYDYLINAAEREQEEENRKSQKIRTMRSNATGLDENKRFKDGKRSKKSMRRFGEN